MALTHESFTGAVFPAEITRQIIDLGLSGAPVFNACTQRRTTREALVFPTAEPDGFTWVAELDVIPTVTPNDAAVVVGVAKIAGQLLVSNEAVADSELPLIQEVGRLISGSMAARADADLLYGVAGNAAAPTGVFDALPTASGDTLRTAVIDAAASILGAGGTPTTVLLAPDLWADEVTRRETTPVAGGALFADLGVPLDVRVASTLQAGDALVLDKSGCFALLRDDYKVEASGEAADAWSRDAVSLRIKARLALAVPVPEKSARALSVITSA